MPLQFVACKFRAEDGRAYTYEWDGEQLAPGDVVKVPDRSGDGWKRVIVDTVTDQAPPFPCKPILGRFEPEAQHNEPEAPAAATVEDDDDAFLKSMMEN